MAYQALEKVEPITHAVGNVGKRIFVIGFSIIAFGNVPSNQTFIGSAIAIAGAGLYSYLKASAGHDSSERCWAMFPAPVTACRGSHTECCAPVVGERARNACVL